MIGEKTAEVEAFWREACAAVGLDPAAAYHASTFADPALSPNVDKIGNLARIGQKRATAHMALDFERSRVPRRAVGDHWIVLTAANAPLCLVRVTKIETTPFREVTPEFAASEGEGDLSWDYWATVHQRYFEKQLAGWGETWRDDLPIVCESFELLWPPAAAGGEEGEGGDGK